MRRALLATLILPLAALQAADFPWQEPHATLDAKGDLSWAPRDFRFVAGPSIRYIDYESGDDNTDGSKSSPWKHHPWDAAATGKAKACSGVQTYVFKGGVIYRGTMVVDDQGTADEPIRLTRDPAWGDGPAVIAGSQVVSGLQSGRAQSDIPAKDKVLSADLDFAPRCVWLVSKQDGSIIRLPLARTPNWRISNWDDIKSEWWHWNNPGKHQDLTLKGYNAGRDTENLTESADYYKGAYIYSEYGYVMGTPYPTKVEAFDSKNKMIAFRSPWGGKKGEHIIRHNRYYLEGKPHYLDDPQGEFWFDKDGAGGTLHLILPAGSSPDDWRIEAARHATLIDSRELRHVDISGLDFMFTNVRWELDANPHRLNSSTGEWSPQIDTDPACIRLVGSGEDITVRNCRFMHINKVVRFRAEGDEDQITGMTVRDCDVAYADHSAMQFLAGGYWGTGHKPRQGRVDEVSVLRNRMRYCGMRPTRYGQGHAIEITYADLQHVAGNILDRCWAAGIFLWGGKNATYDAPLTRIIVHQNKVTDSLLNSNDWGQLEHWHAGPAYYFNNVSGNPGGYWNYNFQGGWNKEHRNARFGHAYYSDHGNKGYFFNNIAWGNENDLQSPLTNCSAFQEIGNMSNSFFNNTAHKFLVGSRRQGPKKGHGKYLGNIFADISLRVFRHNDPKGAIAEANAHHVGELKNEFAYSTNAYANNLVTPTFKEFGVFELVGQRHVTLESFAAANEQAGALAADVGELVEDILPRAESKDFRSSAAADGKGIRTFVPWGLYKTCAEWNFYHDRKQDLVLDEHWSTPKYGSTRFRFPLQLHGITADDFVDGALENWCAGALELDGDKQYLSIANDQVEISHEWTTTNRFKKSQKFEFTASGDDLWSPSVHSSNLLIEVYCKATGDGVLIEKMGEEAGYSLAIDGGKAALTLKGEGQEATVASRSRIADGDWHHLLVEVDRAAKTITLYLDGREDASGQGLGQVSLANDSDVFVGGTPDGRCLKGSLDMMRFALGTLAEAKTSIEELHAWQFEGPQWHDFSGQTPKGKGRDAGAIESN